MIRCWNACLRTQRFRRPFERSTGPSNKERGATPGRTNLDWNALEDKPPWTIANRELLDDWLSNEQDSNVKNQVNLWFAAFELNPYAVAGAPVPGLPGYLWNKIEIRGERGERSTRTLGVMWRLDEDSRLIYITSPTE